MKKTLFIFSIIIGMISCNSSGSTESKGAAAKKEEPEATKGLDLVEKSDCLTCHKVAEKLIGPAYSDVAAKYPHNDETIQMLADKIRKGGSGNWGAIAMLPHPNLSEADAQLMAKYVLSLK